MVDEPSPKRVSALRVPGGGGSYTYDGRPSLRHDPTIRLMPRQRYEQLLLERMHASYRWETNRPRGLAWQTWSRRKLSVLCYPARLTLAAQALLQPPGIQHTIGCTVRMQYGCAARHRCRHAAHARSCRAGASIRRGPLTGERSQHHAVSAVSTPEHRSMAEAD